MSKPLMCHVVAGYPNREDCLRLMLGMQDRGITAIEVQIAFSDPIADGPTIMQANDVALKNGLTVFGSFELIKDSRKQGLNTDIYVMSYLQKIMHCGVAEFCSAAEEAKVKGLIVPDLPYDSPDFSELSSQAKTHNLQIIPVLSPGMSLERLEKVLALNPANIYVTSVRGITGNRYQPAEQLKQLVASIKTVSKATIMIGFGIETPADVKSVLQIGDIAVVGSAIVKRLTDSGVKETLDYISSLAKGMQNEA